MVHTVAVNKFNIGFNLSREQAGFRNACSTTNNIHVVNQIVEKIGLVQPITMYGLH